MAPAVVFQLSNGVTETPVNPSAGEDKSGVPGGGSVIVPPVPAMGIELPAAAAPARLVTLIGVVTAELVIVTLITATTPF